MRPAKEPPEISAGKSDKTRGKPTTKGIADRDTGSALRTIYQRTVEEAIPDEMLSLLGKLD